MQQMSKGGLRFGEKNLKLCEDVAFLAFVLGESQNS